MKIQSSHMVLVLPTFGFSENATFSFDIRTTDASRINAYLVPVEDVTLKKLTIRQLAMVCRNGTNHISVLNRTNTSVGTHVQWTGAVEKMNVYYPIFVNCISNATIYEIAMKFRNRESLVDFRHEFYSFIYVGTGLVHALLAAVWIVNIIWFRQFHIPLQYILAILPVIKAILNTSQGAFWETRRVTDDWDPRIQSVNLLLKCLYAFLVLCSSALILSGWCTYRDDYGVAERLHIIVSSAVLAHGIMYAVSTDSIIVTLISLVWIIVGFLWYAKLSTEYMFSIIKLLDEDLPETVRRKVILPEQFGVLTVCAMALTVLMKSFSATSFEMFPMIELLSYEIGILALEAVRLYVFALRSSYEGSTEHEGEHERNAFALRQILEPEAAILAIVR